jgi:hypothetical protein
VGRSEGEEGQSLIILAFAFLALIAMLGIALDLGLVYVERVRLKRSIDAAVLSGVVELPFEEDAANRALEYLRLNGYDIPNAQVIMRGCVRDVNDYYTASGALCSSHPTPGCGNHDTSKLINASGLDTAHPPYTYTNPANPTSVFYVNTYDYQGDHIYDCFAGDATHPKAFGGANKLEITGTVKVNMNFMQFFGFGAMPVSDNAIAQNVDSLDIAVVFDRSGSMEFDPVCLDCWERTQTAAAHAGDTPPYSGYYTYPQNGVNHTVLFTNTYVQSACNGDNAYITVAPTQPYSRTYSTYKYLIMEAEMYSENNSVPDTQFRQSGKGYWAIQRGNRYYDQTSNFRADPNSTTVTAGGLTPGSSDPALFVAHHPDATYNNPGMHALGMFYTLADAQSGNAPRLTYDITFPPGWGTGTSYVWLKTSSAPDIISGSGCGTGSHTGPTNVDCSVNDRYTMYWQIVDSDSATMTAIAADTRTNNPSGDATSARRNWTWLRLPTTLNPGHHYKLNIWAGSSGYGLDRLIVTDNSSSSGDDGSGAVGSTVYPASGFNMGTAAVTRSSAHRSACDPCNPIFGNTVGPGTSYPTCTYFTTPATATNNLVVSPLWKDSEAPVRNAKEAIKAFILRLDPKYDQVGLATYNDSAPQKTELECMRQHPSTCLGGSNPISFTNVLRDVETVYADGGTYTSWGMKSGLEVLGLNPYGVTGLPPNYGRGGAASKVMILLTDGVPQPPDSAYPAHPSSGSGHYCDSGYYPYASAPGAVSTAFGGDSGTLRGNDCMLWFAEDAKAHGVILFVIGLGYGVNDALLKETATRGGGTYYFAASGADLDLIFDEILQNIYVRLIR